MFHIVNKRDDFDIFSYRPVITLGFTNGVVISANSSFNLISLTGEGILQDLRVVFSNANVTTEIVVDGVSIQITQATGKGIFVQGYPVTTANTTTDYYQGQVLHMDIPYFQSLQVNVKNLTGSNQSSGSTHATLVHLVKA